MISNIRNSENKWNVIRRVVLEKKQYYADRVFDAFNLCLMISLLIIFAWPLWFVVIASFSDPNLVLSGRVLVIPKGITLDSYKKAFEFGQLWTGYANTIFYTLVGTALNLFLSVCFAYPISQKSFMPRRLLLYMGIFTMYFSGGLVPMYLLIRSLGILDTRWAMIIPGALSVYNALIVRNYFENSIPGELKEAATLDGATSLQYLIKVVLPLSKPVFAVVGLYYAVAHWNNYSSALYYIYNAKLYPLQSILRDLLMSTELLTDMLDLSAEELMMMSKMAQTMKYSVIILAAVPMLVIYPLVQRFFVKGVMLGSLKG